MSGTMIGGKTRLLGVMGWPVAHSLSPRLHNYWLAQLQLDAAYLPLSVPETGFAAAARALPLLGFMGANVTIPHKEAAAALVDRLDPVAQRIGAVNTLQVQPEGTLFGTNTDSFGFAENLRQAGVNLAAGTALVLGAGGAARAVLAALIEAGCPRIFLANRSPERAANLAVEFGHGIVPIAWAAWPHHLPETQLLVNSTSRGLKGQEDFTQDLAALPPDAAVNDLVYRPLETGLLRAARAADRKAVDGLGMLLYQAQASFRLWFGVTPPVDETLRRFVLDGLT